MKRVEAFMLVDSLMVKNKDMGLKFYIMEINMKVNIEMIYSMARVIFP